MSSLAANWVKDIQTTLSFYLINMVVYLALYFLIFGAEGDIVAFALYTSLEFALFSAVVALFILFIFRYLSKLSISRFVVFSLVFIGFIEFKYGYVIPAVYKFSLNDAFSLNRSLFAWVVVLSPVLTSLLWKFLLKRWPTVIPR